MKTAVILEAEGLGLSAFDLLNPKELKLIGIGNSSPDSWNVFEDIDTGTLKENIEDLPVMPIDLAISLQPEVIVIAAASAAKSDALKYMALRAGFLGDFIFMSELLRQLTVSGAALRRISRRLNLLGIEGNVAELGCYQGDISWQLNVLFPERKLYLFDTMHGYDDRDIAAEKKYICSDAELTRFRDVNEELLLSRMANPQNVTLKKGWFPETAYDLESEQFAFVYMDADLYQPTFTGLEFFFPRMKQGGVIMLCNYENPAYPGISKALLDFEEKYGAFLILPVGDLKGTVYIVHP